jgi:hypothetical protein
MKARREKEGKEGEEEEEGEGGVKLEDETLWVVPITAYVKWQEEGKEGEPPLVIRTV